MNDQPSGMIILIKAEQFQEAGISEHILKLYAWSTTSMVLIAGWNPFSTENIT